MNINEQEQLEFAIINPQCMRKGYSNHFSVCLSHLDLGASALTTAQTATSTQHLKSYSFEKSEILQFRAVFKKSVHSYYSIILYGLYSI